MTQMYPFVHLCQVCYFLCKAILDKGWSDAEAAKEAATNFPGYKPREDDLTCDTCFNKVNAYYGGGWVNAADPDKGSYERTVTAKEAGFLETTFPLHPQPKDMEDLITALQRDLYAALGIPARFIDHDYHAHDNEYDKAIYNAIKPVR